MRLIPGRPGLKMIDPVTGRPIPEDGSFELREMTTYWFRALECGDAKEFTSAEETQATDAQVEPAQNTDSENNAGGNQS